MKKVIFYKGNFRILEKVDTDYNLDDLKGDCFNPEVNPTIDEQELRSEEKAFEYKVEVDGVYGYVLEKWNPEIDMGWEHVNSCWGFIGQHQDENHYIVDEFKEVIKESL